MLNILQTFAHNKFMYAHVCMYVYVYVLVLYAFEYYNTIGCM